MDLTTLIRHWQLEPLPQEGGYYRRIYTHPDSFSSQNHGQREKQIGSAIYYLVTADTFSALHRVRGEELFFFLEGDSCLMLQLNEATGTVEEIRLGADTVRADIAGKWSRFAAVQSGVWQGLRLCAGGQYALFGVTVMPGFDWEDFELGARNDLIARFPTAAQQVVAFTHSVV
ncbi:MAG: cupin domain-containing protein [Verrucomicrobiota bacterium]|nr:cupin domain-containing protein [Verrucomicrobiota bacterium]